MCKLIASWCRAGGVGSLAVVLAGSLLIGCGPHNNSKLDGSAKDLSFPAADLSGIDFSSSHHDLGNGGDGGAGCTQVTSWPTSLATAKFDSTSGDTEVLAPDSNNTPHAILGIQDWHLNSGEIYPKSYTFSSSTTYNSCDVCVIINDGCGTTSCTDQYLARAGSVKVTQADTNATTGRMTATASNLKLVEWDFNKDIAAGTKCWEVASVSLDVGWK